MNKIINNVLEGNLEVFIIPNKGGLVTKYLSESTQKNMIKNITEIADLSGKEFDPEKDPVVQLWFTGMGCDNLVDHYLHAETEDSKRIYMRANNLGHLPASFFKGKKEGDEIDLVFPATCEVAGTKDKIGEWASGLDIEQSVTVMNSSSSNEGFNSIVKGDNDEDFVAKTYTFHVEADSEIH